MKRYLILACMAFCIFACSKNDSGSGPAEKYPAIKAAFGTNIDPDNLIDYAAQAVPAYIRKNNAAPIPTNNARATLGRVLFYDKALSINNMISCGSCHKQQFAFGDTALVSQGVENGVTIRHSMRLINTRFAVEPRFFWNERAPTLEVQTTMPIQDHAEMGFSGQNGRPGLSVLLAKLSGIAYYKELFRFVYGDSVVTEARMQECLSHFIRSIQSFDSKFDAGRALVLNDAQPFPNFTALENQGKDLWLRQPIFGPDGVRTSGGLGCNVCHNAPEFDISPGSRNNGIIGVIGSTGLDLGNTRAPSLRDLLRTNGATNGPMMHTGQITSLRGVIEHYGSLNKDPRNNNLDARLTPGGFGQKLNLTAPEVDAVVAFMQTLSGTNVYVDPRWSSPFR
jgi:cytochrome c peroxidase